MKIGFYCESPADQAAMAVFTEGILGKPPEPINLDLKAHGVPGFFSALDGVFRGVHYNSDAEGLIVVVDCDTSELHDTNHDAIAGGEENCRFCKVRRIISKATQRLKVRHGLPSLKVAIGVTVPTIEAWYLVGKHPGVGEAAWKVGLAAGCRVFASPQLKKLVYGTDRPSLELETKCEVAEARRIIANVTDIEMAFPVGFGLMAKEIRSWAAQK